MIALTKWRSRFAALVAVVALAVGLLVAAATPVSADAVVGERYSKAGLHCGGQAVSVGTRSVTVGPFQAELPRMAWVYYNCGDRTVHRKAAVGGWTKDGKCFGIGPGLARVLHVITWDNPNIYQGSKSCSP